MGSVVRRYEVRWAIRKPTSKETARAGRRRIIKVFFDRFVFPDDDTAGRSVPGGTPAEVKRGREREGTGSVSNDETHVPAQLLLRTQANQPCSCPIIPASPKTKTNRIERKYRRVTPDQYLILPRIHIARRLRD